MDRYFDLLNKDLKRYSAMYLPFNSILVLASLYGIDNETFWREYSTNRHVPLIRETFRDSVKVFAKINSKDTPFINILNALDYLYDCNHGIPTKIHNEWVVNLQVEIVYSKLMLLSEFTNMNFTPTNENFRKKYHFPSTIPTEALNSNVWCDLNVKPLMKLLTIPLKHKTVKLVYDKNRRNSTTKNYIPGFSSGGRLGGVASRNYIQYIDQKTSILSASNKGCPLVVEDILFSNAMHTTVPFVVGIYSKYELIGEDTDSVTVRIV